MGKRILVVDDEKDLRELLQQRLVKEGYDVSVASDGQEAIDFCRSSHPDLVLMDVALPRIDGYQACEAIKSNPAAEDIPVLFLTGKELEPQSIINRCNELGARGFLRKPCETKELLAKIKEILS